MERHIVERVLSVDGIIGQKTRILVAHAEHLVPLSDTVITFAKGSMSVMRQTPLALNAIINRTTDSLLCFSASDSSSVDQPAGAADMYEKLPEYPKIPSKWLAIWQFVKLSGYGTVAIVLATQLVQTYALYYAQSLCVSLMTDRNPATMLQSLKDYVVVNALVGIGSRQFFYLEDWIRKTVWTTKLERKMRTRILDLILSMPLPLLESLPSSTMRDLYYHNVQRLSHSFPRDLSGILLGTYLSNISTLALVANSSPWLLLLCGPFALVNCAMDGWYGDTDDRLRNVSREIISRQQERINSALNVNLPLLRVHNIVDTYLDKLSRLKSMSISGEKCIDATQGARELVKLLCDETIKTAVLLFMLGRQFFSSVPLHPGELDATTDMVDRLFSSTRDVISPGGIDETYVEPLSEYISYTENMPREQPRVIADSRPRASWPEAGKIEFRQYCLRYRPELEPTLKSLSLVVRSKEKVGVVGRTGAGKSSLTYALMRLVEADSGSIIIDGTDISTIGLHDLRSRISIIPQDPSLFEGTIRDNLDPGHQYTDDEVWTAINACGISHMLERKSSSTPTEALGDVHWRKRSGLDRWVRKNGANFSAGQRQLVSLCHALLWRRKILVLDEATANVDSATDRIMQSVIRREFKDCTVLTIAHRLNTIMDSDRVLVMDQGNVIEFDAPANLLTRGDNHFSRLVESMRLSQRQNKQQ
ncbi:ATP-binding cassette glutathione S-conjugate transporter ycf1 [Coemansia aciculifera]|nr:ATP-binding cassette glutathione S-conjugate transporter ycf1 [Coemansia aciculifera]